MQHHHDSNTAFQKPAHHHNSNTAFQKPAHHHDSTAPCHIGARSNYIIDKECVSSRTSQATGSVHALVSRSARIASEQSRLDPTGRLPIRRSAREFSYWDTCYFYFYPCLVLREITTTRRWDDDLIIYSPPDSATRWHRLYQAACVISVCVANVDEHLFMNFVILERAQASGSGWIELSGFLTQ